MDIVGSVNIDLFLLEVPTGGHQNDRNGCKRRILPLFTQKLPSCHHRHSDIEQNKSRKFFGLAKVVERVLAIGSTVDGIDFVPKECGEHVANRWLIIDHENA